MIKYPAVREDTNRPENLEDCMLKNYPEWFAFLRDELGYNIRLRQMILVTGCDLTSEWATATFIERSLDTGIEFKAGDPTGATVSANLSLWGQWSSSIGVPHRCGPSTMGAREGITTGKESQTFNQCIFLRSLRVSERWAALRVPKVIKAAAGFTDLREHRDDDDSSSPLFSSEEDSDDELLMGDVRFRRLPLMRT